MQKEKKNCESILHQIDPKLKIVKKFSGGMSNQTFLVTDEENFFTFRVPYESGKPFTNFVDEQNVLQQITPLNINSKVLYFNVDNGVKLSEYVDGCMLEEPINYQLVSDTLKKLHQSNLTFNSYNHLQRLDNYELLVNNIDQDYFEIKNNWLQLFNNFLINFVNYPTHGDSQISNWLVTNQQLYLLDWEFSAQNDFIYDICCFGNNVFDQALKLLTVYIDNPTKEHYIRLYGWKVYQSLQWYLVASYKANIKDYQRSGLDFNLIKNNYLDKAKYYWQELEEIIKK